MKREKKVAAPVEEIVVKSNAPTTIYSSPGSTTVVVKDRKGKIRNVDEYNRRYDSRDNDFVMENDTLYINEKEDDGLDGEWVNGEFEGSQDDYEYATRIIRFRNPRYAISISSPLYWDVVYGLNSWDWNVYTDGLYAYAFPTFTNRLWWDWRYNSYGWGGYPYYGWGWNSWYGPSWSFSWGGWYGGGWWGHHHHYHHHYYPGWYHGGGGHWGNAYTNRRSFGSSRGNRVSAYGGSTTTRRSSYVNGGQTVRRSGAAATGQVRRGSTDTNRRVVGTRSSAATRSSATRSSATRSDAATSRRSTYTRPSSTRSSSYGSSRSTVEGVRRNTSTAGGRSSVGTSSRSTTRSSATYNRGSSTAPVRSNFNNNRSSRSYNNSGSNSRSSSSFSSGGGSRSSGGSYSTGGGSSRSSGGSSRRR